jgi:hypothetical protein
MGDRVIAFAMRANFVGLYDSNGNLKKEMVDKFDEIHRKYGGKDFLLL